MRYHSVRSCLLLEVDSLALDIKTPAYRIACFVLRVRICAIYLGATEPDLKTRGASTRAGRAALGVKASCSSHRSLRTPVFATSSALAKSSRNPSFRRGIVWLYCFSPAGSSFRRSNCPRHTARRGHNRDCRYPGPPFRHGRAPARVPTSALFREWVRLQLRGR